MQTRNLMLAVTGGGVLLGTIAGLATNTEMKAPPPAPWSRHVVQSDAPPAESYAFVDSGPQDLSPNWYADRTPTWKRASVAAAGYAPQGYADYGLEPVDEPAQEVSDEGATDEAASERAPTPAERDAAAAAEAAASAAQDAMMPPRSDVAAQPDESAGEARAAGWTARPQQAGNPQATPEDSTGLPADRGL